MKKYRVYCETESAYKYIDSLMPDEGCPDDANHTVTSGSLVAVGESNSDYKVLRNSLIIQVATEGFTNLSQAEKEIASEHFAVTKADRDTVHTIEQQVVFGGAFHANSTKSRMARSTAASVEVYNRIENANERADLMNDVGLMMDTYNKFGLEGTIEDGIEGLFDYLESRVGTSYENTGLLSKTYTVEGMTVAQLSAHMMDILKNGNY